MKHISLMITIGYPSGTHALKYTNDEYLRFQVKVGSNALQTIFTFGKNRNRTYGNVMVLEI